MKVTRKAAVEIIPPVTRYMNFGSLYDGDCILSMIGRIVYVF